MTDILSADAASELSSTGADHLEYLEQRNKDFRERFQSTLPKTFEECPWELPFGIFVTSSTPFVLLEHPLVGDTGGVPEWGELSTEMFMI